jgi:hypothetical protein
MVRQRIIGSVIMLALAAVLFGLPTLSHAAERTVVLNVPNCI